MGSTLSLADKPKGMIRSGSFRDPVDDGEGVLRSCPGEGGCAGGLHARLSRCCGAIGCFGASRPRRRSRGRQLQGAWWTPLRWHLLWAAACPVPCECPVSLGWPQGAVAPGRGDPSSRGGWQSPQARPERWVRAEGAPHALPRTVHPGRSPATRREPSSAKQPPSHPLPPCPPQSPPALGALSPAPCCALRLQPLGMPPARGTLTRCRLFCCSSRIGAVPGLERVLHLLLRKSRLRAAPLCAWLGGPGWERGGSVHASASRRACPCLAALLTACLCLSVSLLSRRQAEEKMQSEVSLHPLLAARPCRRGEGERLAPHSLSALPTANPQAAP